MWQNVPRGALDLKARSSFVRTTLPLDQHIEKMAAKDILGTWDGDGGGRKRRRDW